MTDSQMQEHETIDRLTRLPRELKTQIFIVLDHKSRAMLTRVNRHFADRNNYAELKCPADFWSLTTPVERHEFIHFLWNDAIFTQGRRLMPCRCCRTWHPANEMHGLLPHHVSFMLYNKEGREFAEYCVACALVRRALFEKAWNPTVILVPTKIPCSIQNKKLEAYFCKLCNKFARVDWCHECRTCKACVENRQEVATAEQPASSRTYSPDPDLKCSGQRPTCHHYWVGFKLVTNAPWTRFVLRGRGSQKYAGVVTVPSDSAFAIEDDGELYIKPRPSTSDDDEGNTYHEKRHDDYHGEGNGNPEEYDDGYQDESNDRHDGYHKERNHRHARYHDDEHSDERNDAAYEDELDDDVNNDELDDDVNNDELDDDANNEERDNDTNHEVRDDDASHEEQDGERAVPTALFMRAISENDVEEQENFFDAMEQQDKFFDAMEHQGDLGAAIPREVDEDAT